MLRFLLIFFLSANVISIDVENQYDENNFLSIRKIQDRKYINDFFLSEHKLRRKRQSGKDRRRNGKPIFNRMKIASNWTSSTNRYKLDHENRVALDLQREEPPPTNFGHHPNMIKLYNLTPGEGNSSLIVDIKSNQIIPLREHKKLSKFQRVKPNRKVKKTREDKFQVSQLNIVFSDQIESSSTGKCKALLNQSISCDCGYNTIKLIPEKWVNWYIHDPLLVCRTNTLWLSFNPMRMKFTEMVLALLYLLLIMFGCLGNGLVIYIFSSSRSLRKPSNILILNLACSDFILVGELSLYFYNVGHNSMAIGRAGCSLYGFLGGLSGTCSIMTLAMISVDRCLVISYPLDPGKKLTSLKVFIIIFITWLYSAAISSIPLFGIKGIVYVPEGHLSTCSFDYLSEDVANSIFIWTFFIAAWLLPLCTISFCYSKIVVVARKNFTQCEDNVYCKKYGRQPIHTNEYSARFGENTLEGRNMKQLPTADSLKPIRGRLMTETSSSSFTSKMYNMRFRKKQSNDDIVNNADFRSKMDYETTCFSTNPDQAPHEMDKQPAGYLRRCINAPNYDKRNAKLSTEMKITRIAASIITLWFVAWTPYAVVALIGISGHGHLLSPSISMFPALACKLSACIDPYIYCLSHPRCKRELIRHYRRLRKYICRHSRKKSRDFKPEKSSSREMRGSTVFEYHKNDSRRNQRLSKLGTINNSSINKQFVYSMSYTAHSEPMTFLTSKKRCLCCSFSKSVGSIPGSVAEILHRRTEIKKCRSLSDCSSRSAWAGSSSTNDSSSKCKQKCKITNTRYRYVYNPQSTIFSKDKEPLRLNSSKNRRDKDENLSQNLKTQKTNWNSQSEKLEKYVSDSEDDSEFQNISSGESEAEIIYIRKIEPVSEELVVYSISKE